MNNNPPVSEPTEKLGFLRRLLTALGEALGVPDVLQDTQETVQKIMETREDPTQEKSD